MKHNVTWWPENGPGGDGSRWAWFSVTSVELIPARRIQFVTDAGRTINLLGGSAIVEEIGP